MTELLTAAQMRAVEQAAIESGEVTGLELMERAGRGVVEAIFAEWPELRATSHHAVILCGPGNNGGDGFVVARLLHEQGWEVEVFLYGDPEKLPPDARVNWERWAKIGSVRAVEDRDANTDVYPQAEIETDFQAMSSADLLVDALFGTGLTRPLKVIWPLHSTENVTFDDGLWWTGEFVPPRVVAVDLVSEICSDSGRKLEHDDQWIDLGAHLTVTFHRAKVGHYLDASPKFHGKLVVSDIGLSQPTRGNGADRPVELARPLVELIATPNLGKRHPSPYLDAHKYTHGHALILSGRPGHGGAARLAARGTLRIGAGLVTVGCPPEALTENAAQLTAIMLRPIADADALSRTLEDARLNALCLGPGLGVTEDTRALVAAALADGTERSRVKPGARAVVLDADALTAFSEDPNALFSMLHRACVLTPHAGEFARLFPDIAEKLAAAATRGPAYSKVDATREAAARAGCTVLHKGPDTVIANETGAARISSGHYDRAAPWLATAGSGDVLAGFITGLLARGFPPLDAAATAAWLHVECAFSFGPGLIAEDIPEELPRVFRTLGL